MSNENTKVSEVKTITEKLDYPVLFDNSINVAIADGWVLSERGVMSGYLYAFLVKHDTVGGE